MQTVKVIKSGYLTTKKMALCSLFTSLIAAGAFIKIVIPIQPFPMHFTLQFFFVLLSGFLLGGRTGAASVSIYLVLGLLGVPIFAAGGGLSYLVRPTFGFLLGFVIASAVTGRISSLSRKYSIRWYLFSAVLGMLVMYLAGMIYFYLISNFVVHIEVTWKIVFFNCFLMTVGGDIVLCVMAAIMAVRLKPMLRLMDRV